MLSISHDGGTTKILTSEIATHRIYPCHTDDTIDTIDTIIFDFASKAIFRLS